MEPAATEPTAPAHPPTDTGLPAREEAGRIWAEWIALWNGDLERAHRIVAEDYVLHMTPVNGEGLSSFAGPGGLAAWIAQLHAAIRPLRFSVQVEPLFDRDLIAGRWLAEGTYVGGFPGATAPAGTSLRFAGADFLRIGNGQIVEYWLSSDVLDMIAQLGIR